MRGGGLRAQSKIDFSTPAWYTKGQYIISNSSHGMPVEQRGKKHGAFFENEFARKLVATLLGVFLVYSIVFLAARIRNELQAYRFIGQSPKSERTIHIEADAKVTAVPDIGIVTMGVQMKGQTVAEVQGKSDATVRALIDKLKGLGVDPKDIQTTNYNIYPKTQWTEERGEEPDGYEVNQQVTIKIRDLSKAGAVLALAGDVGANIVQGVQFTIDDPETYRSQARDLALQKAGEKAVKLARALGVSLVSIVSYNEFEADGKEFGGMLYSMRADGLGGGPAPFESGSADVVMRVSVTYEIQ